MDYVAQLREGILEAYTGVVTGFKNTEKGLHLPFRLLLPFTIAPSTSTTASRAQHPRARPPMSSRRGENRLCRKTLLWPHW